MPSDHKSASEAQASRMRSVSATRLHGRWLLLARIGCVVVAALALSLFLLGLPPYAAQLHTICTTTSTCSLDGALSPAGVQALHALGVSVESYIWYTIVVTVLVALVWASIGFVIFWHRSNDWMALLTALFLVTFNLTLTNGPMASLAHFSPGWTLPIACLGFLGIVLEGFFLYLFPSGRFVPRWMGWIFVLLLVLQSTSFFLSPNWADWLNNLVALTFFCTVGFSHIYRYQRVSTSTERQQTKWVLFGILVSVCGGLALTLAPSSLYLQSGLFDVANDALWFIIVLPVPLSIGVAMLHYRLWDIDIIIKRTLVYGTLTASLTLIYVGSILLLQFLLSGFTAGNSLAIVASTLTIAALFQPLRHRIQAVIGRRFYRRKYDAVRTVEAFSATLRSELDLEQLRKELLAVVEETMQPSQVSLCLRPTAPDRKQQTAWSSTPSVPPSGGDKG